ncbi:hypothetical protein CAPTEDRAFT_193399 [Capitella teleta]|uniref:Uncharacterized protein n=1 Tax=Capitella teleta TaxID=283909 RepID=R7TU62_CAPTE|nr:hypothetical protein CAPTEDRAFT_193399 [Capitella teleta]|eukprot:ELT97443.1 hypothetical protein CAPTEDRAFT_193399 [Capitella teleta]
MDLAVAPWGTAIAAGLSLGILMLIVLMKMFVCAYNCVCCHPQKPKTKSKRAQRKPEIEASNENTTEQTAGVSTNDRSSQTELELDKVVIETADASTSTRRFANWKTYPAGPRWIGTTKPPDEGREFGPSWPK